MLFKYLRPALQTALVLVATNTSSFATVGMEKHISGFSPTEAAVVNALSATPFLYDLGFHIGHMVFYGDENFLSTARDSGVYSRIPRPYASRLSPKNKLRIGPIIFYTRSFF